MDIVERLREWKNSPLFNWADLDPSDMEEAAHEIEQLRTQSRMYWTKYWDTAKELDIMRKGLECIVDSDDVSVPNYVRQFARVLLGEDVK